MKRLILILIASILCGTSFAQVKKGSEKKDLSRGRLMKCTVIDGDTMPIAMLPETKIVDAMIFKSKRQAQKFDKLKRDVKKAYPYAMMASVKLKEYNAKLATMHLEAERKLYMKKAEKEIIKQFEGDIRQLTLNQGKILIKLIDRETGATSYNLVKELRGSFSAWMWQSLAVFFGANLKSEYDGKGDDKMIENIIGLIQSGEI